ncbi:MoxR family ATPase [Candidatus Pacearchaeota archaeon]|nr:MoxR family ATPase [Candidatus Pacearchaeota archaeon]
MKKVIHSSHSSDKKLSGAQVEEVSKTLLRVRDEVSKVFFGHGDTVDSLLRALLCDGHVLIEGVPGIAKTLLIKSLAHVSGCSSKRIQFTVDLLPTDIVGLTTYEPRHGFKVAKGPIFAQFIIADEINRSPPKTQSALIEAMQEKQVTIGNHTYPLPSPFFVMANQNPLEHEGVYSLPEAQLDRFLFKVLLGYPDEAHEEKIMEDNVTFKKFESLSLKPVISPEKILQMQKITHQIYLDPKIKKYIVSLVSRTRKKDFHHGQYIQLGASPRATIALYIGAKAEALLKGRNYVIPQDVKAVAYDSLRHRLILSYRARAEGVTVDAIIHDLLNTIETP